MADKSRVTLCSEYMLTPPFGWKPANDLAEFPRYKFSQELQDDMLVWDELFQGYFLPRQSWSNEHSRDLYERIAPRLVERMRQELDPELYTVDLDLWPLE